MNMQNKKIVFISEQIDTVAYQKLSTAFILTDQLNHPEELSGIFVRTRKIPESVYRKAKKLEAVAVHGTGTDHVYPKLFEKRGIALIKSPGMNAQSVAELAIGLLLSLCRKIPENDQRLKDGTWDSRGSVFSPGMEISNKTVGLVGYGKINQRVGKILQEGFGCRIFYYRNPQTLTEKESDFFREYSLERIFSNCDAVIIGLPLTEETENLINRKIFDASNPNLLLVNISRGGIVNEEDLYQALLRRRIRGAASDVFLHEPPSKKNPLIQLHNFIATGHIGANTEEALCRVGNHEVDEMIRLLNGSAKSK